MTRLLWEFEHRHPLQTLTINGFGASNKLLRLLTVLVRECPFLEELNFGGRTDSQAEQYNGGAVHDPFESDTLSDFADALCESPVLLPSPSSSAESASTFPILRVCYSPSCTSSTLVTLMAGKVFTRPVSLRFSPPSLHTVYTAHRSDPPASLLELVSFKGRSARRLMLECLVRSKLNVDVPFLFFTQQVRKERDYCFACLS